MALRIQPDNPEYRKRDLWSSIGEWAAPLIVCIIFLGMLGAMLAVFLGE